MNCIGKIDNNKSMLEQIDNYKIPSATGLGTYDVKDLKSDDKEFIKGMACMIDTVNDFEYMPHTGIHTVDNLVKEISESIKEDLITQMLGELGMSLYSIMDSDEDYWEKDDEDK